MTRIEEINTTLSMLELTYKAITDESIKRSDVIKAIDWLRQTAFLLSNEKAALEQPKQAPTEVINSEAVTAEK